MRLKNYTSSVPASQSIERIERLLIDAGATGIMKDYKDGKISGIYFRLQLPDKEAIIRLPAKAEAVFACLRKLTRNVTTTKAKRLLEQSERTAWKLMLDWTEVQMSLVHMQQADMLEVFLPYAMVNDDQTFYAQIKERKFLALAGPEATNGEMTK